MPEDGAVRDPKSLLPAFDANYALAIRGPYILIHELLDPLIKNKGEMSYIFNDNFNIMDVYTRLLIR